MIFKKIEKNLKEILENKLKIILGLSGGPDSVFLFEFLKKLHNENKIELICAHLDHGWRQDSSKDVKFCQDLCKTDNIQIFTAHAKDLALNLKFNGSKEELGRKLRRHFFENLLKKQNANYIALAQHLQDQQEIFFWRIIRGCTLSGLSCMKKINIPYLRPLLNITKNEILNYLHKNKIEYLTDQTNDSDKFLRNRIRKHVIPAIQKCDKRFNKKFESSLQSLQEEDCFLKDLAKNCLKKIFKYKQKTGVILPKGDLKAFLTLDPVLQNRILLEWFIQTNVSFNPSKNYLNEVLRFLKNQNGGSHQLGPNWKVYKKKNRFWIQ